MFVRILQICICMFILCLSSTISHASPITANVAGSAVGEEDTAGFEYRNGYEWDDENQAQDNAFTDRIDLYYNITDMTQFRVFFNRENPGNDDSDFTNIFIEPTFQLFEKEKDGFDGALLTGLTLADGDNRPNQFRTILSGTFPLLLGYFRHNSILAHQFGQESTSGLRYEARWRIMFPAPYLGKKTDVGVEMFNNFGNIRTASGFNTMTHRAGPLMTGNLTKNLGFQTGVLAGLSSNAPDVAVKFWLNYEFDTNL